MNMLEADELVEDAERSMSKENDSRMRPMSLEVDPCLDKHCGAGRVCKVSSFLSSEKIKLNFLINF